MGEIKSVKVDNWGVFFLQKLQNFFNKTDYCDLTLQFRDNSQLKVHRLVLSACTDYFNVLEQTCDVVDDALLMPDELQADVVVPIVNFMYTGTLEFELKMYGKLLRTAKEMNMTVLLKLLEAHRRTMEGVNRALRPPSPKTIRRRPVAGVGITSPQVQQQRRILTSANVTPQQRVAVQTKSIATNAPQQSVQYRPQIGSTSLLRTSAGGVPIIRSQYGTTTIYSNSQQQIKSEDQHISTVKQHHQQQQQQPTSPFEQLRKGYNNNKRPMPTTFVSPPAKKPNIEDVKEFAEQQRMRKQIAAEYGEDPDYEGMLDDDIHNDDDDDDNALASSSTSAIASTSKQSAQHGGTTITFRQELNDKPPTIVVKDSSNSKMNHAKIISEVLRQYPHLVKGTKNIKLKIMPNVGGQSQKIIVKKEPVDSTETNTGQQQQQQNLPTTKMQAVVKSADKTTQQTAQQLTGPKAKVAIAVQKTPVSVTATTSTTSGGNGTATIAAAAAVVSAPGTTQKRRIDSKTMHALISQGAENTTGPWLCLRCGVNGRPISIPSYRGFRRHLINTHKETIDPALCEHCGWRSVNNRELHFHMQMEHRVRTTLYTFPECLMCAEIFLDTNALNQHMINSHPDESKQKCIYCNKIFAKEIQLYTHMKTFHKKQALEDGIIDYSDDEFAGSQDEVDDIQNNTGGSDKKETKIKILSDISLPSAGTLLKLEPSSEAAALSTVASGIAASIGISSADEFMQTAEAETEAGTEPKFVNADGNEMVLTEEQRKEIMSQLNEGGTANAAGGVVMVLNETAFAAAETGVAIEDNNVATDSAPGNTASVESETAETQAENNTTGEGSATEEEYDDSQIFNELTSQTNASVTEEEDEEEVASASLKKDTSAAVDESKESIEENLEWAENLISAHEMADAAADAQKVAEDKAKKADDISKKLKELTGDWSDDDIEDDEEPEAEADADTSLDADASTEMDVDAEVNALKVSTLSSDEVKESDKSNSDINKIEQEESSATIAQENVTVANEEQEPSVDDDDIDMAMQSLHKDEHEDAEKSEDKKSDVAPNEEQGETETMNIKMEIKQTVEKESVAVKEEKESDKGTSEKEKTEKDAKNDVSKSLLDDLIADANLSKVDEDEFITVKPEAISPEHKPITAAIEQLQQKENESESEKATSATAAEAEEVVDQVVEAKQNPIDETKDDDVDAITKELETQKTDTTAENKTAAISAVDEVEKTETPSATTVVAAAIVAATTPTEIPKTEDKVKSLISEWGDDFDDDGNENIAGDGADEL